MTRNFVATWVLAGTMILWAWGAEAQSQQPAISSGWDSMNLSQDECFVRSLSTMRRLNYKRIEKIGNTTFGDQGNFQFGIRCIAEKQLYYVFGGGPGNSSKQLDKQINDMKSTFGDGR